MPKLYPYVVLLLLGVFAAGNPRAAAQCSNFTFTTTVTNEKCYNGTTGSISVTVTGTDGPYQYQLSQANAGGWSSVSTFTGLIAGSYPVSVKGASGCISTSYVTITQPNPISVNYKETDPVCLNTNTGTIQQTSTISGGTTPYSYVWTLGGANFSTAANLTNLAPGNYQVVVNDANGCQASPNIVEGSSTPIAVTGFNSDIVADGTSVSPDGVVNDGIDACPGGYVFYAQGYSNASGTAGSTGLPTSGAFTSANISTNSYQLTAYSSNNALVLFSSAGCNATTSGTLTFKIAASYGTIYVLGTSGTGSSTINYQVNYTDGSTPTTGTVSFFDWATSSTQAAISGLGRIQNESNGVYDGSSDFSLYEEPITIPPANATKKVQSITFSYNTAGTGRASIMALTGLAANPGLAAVNVGSGSSAPASVSIADDARNSKFCTGQTVTFTATPTNGGANPTYQWQLNGANITGATSPTYAAAPTAGKAYTVLMTSALTCATPTTSTSNGVTLATGTVKPNVTVDASATTICSGTPVTFTPTVTNGGSAPTYQWDVNGTSTGVTTPTYTSSALNNNDKVTVVVTSNISCATNNPVTSSNTTMAVTSVAAPTVSIAASATSIQTGATVNFTSSMTNGGATPAYQWYRNGTAISGATASTYSTSTITNGDVFSVTLSSSASCVSSPFVFSNYVAITVTVPAPAAPALVAGGNTTNNNKPPFSGTALALSTVTIYVDGVSIGTTTADGSGNYTFMPSTPIADGTHAITATATDANGNTSSPSPVFTLTVDTTAPLAPTIGLASGSSPVDNNKPPFAGSAEANSTVTIYLDGVSIGTTTASASGAWTFTPSTPIADGPHTLTATATDAVGNVSPTSAPFSLTIDTVAPLAPTIALASGSSPLNNNKPPFVGTAEPNSTVTVYVDGVSIGTTVADGSGNYTFTPASAIADGTHAITSTATDAAGNVSPASSPLSLTIDTTAPLAPTIGLASGSSPTNNNKPPFTGTAEANSTVTIYVDGVSIGTTTADASGNWTYTPTSAIADGTHAITATATDAAGNVSPASSPLSLTIDTSAPTAPTLQLASGNNPTNNNEPPLKGTAEANSTVTIYVDGVSIGTTTADASGNWTYTPTSAIADGTHAITATATDAAGNVSPASSPLSLTIDTSAPTAPTLQLASGNNPTNNNKPPFKGTAEPNSTVTIYVDGVSIGTTTADASGNWTYTPTTTITDGTHAITATATDAAGNVSPASSPLGLTIDTSAPTAPTVQLASGTNPTNNNEPPLKGTAEPNSMVTIYVDGTAIGTTTADAAGNWTYTPTSAIADGAHAITATATDAAGNISPASSPLSLTIITVAPTAPTIGLASGSSPTNNNKPPFSGTAQPNSTVTIYVDGVSFGTTIADGSGNYTFAPSSAIADGTHSITATATDAAGNVSPASAPLSLTIDTSAPAAPTVQLASGTNPDNNNEPPFKGTAEPNSSVTIYVDGNAIGTTTADASGNWTYTPTTPIADGTHNITATATDSAGNISPASSPLSLTIDTTAPTAPTVQLASGNNPTNNNKPPLKGTAEPNSTVTIYVDGNAIGTTIADASGNWTYTPTSAITDGTHAITATATDAAGNVSPTSAPLSLTIDTSAPTAPTVQLASGNNPTNNNEPPLKGTAEPNSTVTVYVDGAAIGTTTADASGNWTYTPTSAIADGTHAVTATATDAAGNVSTTSAPLSLTIDTSAPTAPTVQLASGNNPDNNNEPPLRGTAEPNSTVTIYVDGTAIGTTTADASGNWTYTPTSAIADGTHAISATATDAAGNVSPASSPLSLTIDTTAPTAPTVQLASGTNPTNNNEPPLKGTAEPNSTVTIYIDGAEIGTTTADASGNWTYTPTTPIADGTHAITATAKDAAGNVSPASSPLSLTIDTSAPAGPTVQLASGTNPTNNNEPPLKGTAEPNSTVTIYVDGTAIGTTTTDASGNWTYIPTIAIADGTHAITATATDAAGNVSPVSSPLSLTIDTSAPTAPTVQLASGNNPTNNNEPPLKGTAEPNSTVTIYVDGTAIGTTTADASGNWTYTPTSAIADGTHAITATATDAAGNVSPTSSPLSLTIDTVVPTAPTIGLASGSNPTNNNKPPFGGTAEPNSTVTIYVDGVSIGTTTADGSGNYTFTPSTPIADGTHSITATATDAAGNVSPGSSPLNLTVVTVAPAAPTISLANGSSPTNNNKPTFSGTAQPNSTVTIYVDGVSIGTTTADGSGNYTFTPSTPIADGTHSITATATDAAGNVSPGSSPLNLTVVTVAPAAPTISLANGSSPTNNNKPTFSGTAQPNSTVTIYVDGVSIGTTTADGSGNYTFTPSSAIADGTHAITATATDAAGNVSPASSPLSLTIDTSAPAAPTVQLASGNNPTNNNEPPFKGTAEPNSTLTIYVDGTTIGTTTADASGNWTYTPTSAIADGTHAITATATDAAGNVGPTSAPLSLTIDTSAPAAPTVQLASGNNPTNNNEPPLKGTAEPNSTVTIYVDGTAIGTTTADASGNWTYTPTTPIADGTHNITATATDAAGNVSPASSPLSLTVDTSAPTAPTVQLASGNNPTNNNEPPLKGTAEPNSTVTIYVDGTAIGTTTADASGNWTYTPTTPIADGTHAITATATDAASNVSPASSPLSLTVDTTAPTVPTVQLASGNNPTNNNEPPLKGTAEPNSTVTIYVDGTLIGTTTADASGNWTYTTTTPIADGMHAITATATDAAGNVSPASSPLSLTIDTSAPTAPTVQLASGNNPTNNNEPPLKGIAEPNSTVTIYVDGTAIGTTTADASGNWTYTPTTPIADGMHAITATATDAAGNVSPASSPLSLTIDTSAPTAPTVQLASGNNPTNNNEPPLKGTAEPNSTVTIYVDGAAIGTTTADAAGNWTYTPTTPIADGIHAITATATDAAGNVSPASSPLSLTVDTSAPTAPTVQLASGTNPTNNNEPPLKGTAEPNSTVTIYVDGTAIGTSTADASGNWTYTPTSAIADGTHAITATATDAAGNVSPTSAPLSLTIDTSAPTAPTVQLASGTNPTNNNEPPLKGTAEPNSTVTIYVDGTAIGTTTTDASGNWTYTPTSAIPDGTHSITATATDAAGNVSPASAPLSVTIDTSAPTAPTVQLASGNDPTNNNEPPLKGTAEPNSTVTIYVDGTAIGTTTADALGNWTYTPTSAIPDGTHAITATATDAAGNVSPASSPLSLTINTSAPTAPTVQLASGNNPTNNNEPPLKGTAEPNSTVTIYVDGTAIGTTTADAAGNWTYTPTSTIADGTHAITATATDAAGNVSPTSASLSLTIDTSAPTAPTVQLASGNNPDNNNEPPFKGTAEPNSTVTIYVDGNAIGTTTTDASGNWTYTPTSAIPDGTHAITATATDAAGNVSPTSAPLSLTIDTTAPAAPTVQLASGTNPTNNNEPPLKGTAEPNGTVTIYVDGNAIGTTTTDASGNWTYTPTAPIADGTHNIIATATDAAGNVSPASAPLSLTIDTVAPIAPTIGLASGSSPTNNNKPPFSGTAQPNSTVTIYVDGVSIGTTTADGSGNYTFAPSSAIADGTHSITATATDAAGNVSPASAPLSLTIDTSAPAAPTVQLASGNNPDNNNEPPLKGTAEPNSTVTIYVDGTAIGTTTADAGGNWTYTPTTPIADGTHAITATTTDAAGNVSPTSAPLSLTIDTTSPTAPTVQLASGTNPTNNNEPPLKGTAEPNSTVTIYVDGNAIGTTTADATGNWTYTPTTPIADGTHNITATATDAAGNVSPASAALPLTINTTAPTSPTVQLASGKNPDNNNEPPLKGTADPNTTVTIYVDGTAIGTTTADASGNWTYTPTSPIADGTHNITATATDAAGAVSPMSPAMSLTIDTTPPATPPAPVLIGGNNNITNTTTPTITGTAEPNAIVTIYVGGVAVGTTTAGADGSYTYTFSPALAQGSQTVTVSATDAAGNTSGQSPALNITINTTTPGVTLSAQVQQSSQPFTVTITFSEPVIGFDTSFIELSNGTMSDLTEVSAGIYTVVVTPQTAGNITMSVDKGAAMDSAGNASLASNVLAVDGKFGGTVSAIYPVPASSVLNIRFAGTVDPVGRIRLVNMAGQYVLDQETSLQDHFVTLNVSMLAPGAYALEIKTANFSYVTKIIIAR